MRRKDREITDVEEIIRIMEKCDVCRLALFDDEYPYIIPLNFGFDFEQDTLYLYFHSAQEGHKLDLIKKNNKVTFEMDCEHQMILYDERMSCTMGYASVIGHGEIEFVDDNHKYEALKIMMRHYHNEDFCFNKDMMKVTAVYRLKVNDMVGKRRNNIHEEERSRRYIHLV